MSEQAGAICYILQETKDSPLYLCIMDRENEQFHKFAISVGAASRLAQECSAVVHSAISGYSQKHTFQEVVAVLSKRLGEGL